MLGVVLAAGRGTRLMPITAGRPKALVEVAPGLTLLELCVRLFLASGLEELVLVVRRKDRAVAEAVGGLRSHTASLEVVESPEYWRENGISLLTAWGVVGSEDFVLGMCDHVVEPRVYEAAARAMPLSLCIDREPAYLPDIEEATKVSLGPGGEIRAIGKGLVEWDAIDMGVFRLNEVVFDALKELAGEKAIISLSDCVRYLLSKGVAIGALDMTGSLWIDVDTPEALEHARTAVLPELLDKLGLAGLTSQAR